MKTPTSIHPLVTRRPSLRSLEPDALLLAMLRRTVCGVPAATAVLIALVAGLFIWVYLSLLERLELA